MLNWFWVRIVLVSVLANSAPDDTVVLDPTLLICTVWFCVLFCLFVQFGYVYGFAHFYSLVLRIVLLICTV